MGIKGTEGFKIDPSVPFIPSEPERIFRLVVARTYRAIVILCVKMTAQFH